VKGDSFRFFCYGFDEHKDDGREELGEEKEYFALFGKEGRLAFLAEIDRGKDLGSRFVEGGTEVCRMEGDEFLSARIPCR